MRRRTSRRVFWTLALILILALVGPPFVNVNRYRGRVAHAIGRAFGRDVTASSIGFQLIPRPAVVLYNFVADDDPGYSAEPMLRADSVTAYIRLTSLWRGRLEIGTLDLDNPSLNLVRRADGHWNIEELIERASQSSQAPTAKVRPEARPRFPYVEASSGRINFKLGEVKKAFAFTDADFALWQQSENLWRFRLEARPVRTDLGISDTGTLALDGHFQRASNLRNTPVQMKVSYRDAPIGQLAKLFYGRERGWRGDLSATAELTGTPASLSVTADAQVSDFHRYDISMGESLRLLTHCTATYSSDGDDLRDLHCESPVGSGILRVRGDVQDWGADGFNLGISGEHIPADRVVAFARHAKKDLPSDLTAKGLVEATLEVRKAPGTDPQWSGGGQTTGLALQSSVLKQDLDLGQVEFAVPEPATVQPTKAKRKAHPALPPAPMKQGFQLVVKPFAVPLGDVSPATASGELDQQQYSFHLGGGAELGWLLNLAQAIGIGTPGVGLAGSAQVNVDVSGPWLGFAMPVPTGKITVSTATAELQGITEPMLVDTASLTLDHQMVNITAFSGSFSRGTQLSGSATFPLHCTAPESCVVNFDVRTPNASLVRLNELFNPAFSHQPWYHLLAIGRRHQDALMKLRANGHFAIARFEMGTMTASNINGSLDLSSGKLRVHELRADLLGGHQDGSWLADFTVSPPRFMGNGVLKKVSMSQVASMMHDSWASGSVDADYNVTLSGMNPAKLQGFIGGTADFTWSNGALRHVILEGRGIPMAFSVFAGKLALQDGTFTLSDCKLQSGGNKYLVTGTASSDGKLDVKLDRAGRSYVISGTIDKPKVQTVTPPPTEAALR